MISFGGTPPPVVIGQHRKYGTARDHPRFHRNILASDTGARREGGESDRRLGTCPNRAETCTGIPGIGSNPSRSESRSAARHPIPRFFLRCRGRVASGSCPDFPDSDRRVSRTVHCPSFPDSGHRTRTVPYTRSCTRSCVHRAPTSIAPCVSVLTRLPQLSADFDDFWR